MALAAGITVRTGPRIVANFATVFRLLRINPRPGDSHDALRLKIHAGLGRPRNLAVNYVWETSHHTGKRGNFMTYHYRAYTRALGLAAAIALAPMAASAATVDIKIQSFGELGDLTASPVSNPDIIGALAARDAFIGKANILAIEDFTGRAGQKAGEAGDGLETNVGTFTVSGALGTGATADPDDKAVVKTAPAGADIFGRYNVAVDGMGDHEGGEWLDSADRQTIDWSIPGTSGLTKFNRIAFFLTDVNDSGNLDFRITADGKNILGDPTIVGERTNGLLNLVTMQFSEFVTGDVLISMTNNTGGVNDGYGIDTITVAAIPLPASALLLLGGLGGLGGLSVLRRRKRAA